MFADNRSGTDCIICQPFLPNLSPRRKWIITLQLHANIRSPYMRMPFPFPFVTLYTRNKNCKTNISTEVTQVSTCIGILVLVLIVMTKKFLIYKLCFVMKIAYINKNMKKVQQTNRWLVYAERAICYRPSVCPSVCPTDCHTGESVKSGWS